MKRHLIICSILTLSFFSAQKNDWKKIDTSFYQKVVKENSALALKNSDSITVEFYGFEHSEKINLDDLTKLIMIPRKISFEEFKIESHLKNFDPELLKNSEYQIKYEPKEQTIFNYSLYLFDNISEQGVKELTEFVKQNLKAQKIVFVSKEDAVREARKTIGVDTEAIFEENIFPASLDVTLSEKMCEKLIQKRFPQLVEDIKANNEDSRIIIIKIKT